MHSEVELFSSGHLLHHWPCTESSGNKDNAVDVALL